jgi:selenocysteine-specific elongation factor
MDTIEARVLDKLESQEQMSAPEFKELAGGVSRKWAIPLLEYLDRNKVTLRVGDVRKLHPSRRKPGS